jgi:hypothetical protein
MQSGEEHALEVFQNTVNYKWTYEGESDNCLENISE